MEKAARLARRSSGLFGRDKEKDRGKQQEPSGYTTDEDYGGNSSSTSNTGKGQNRLSALTPATKTAALPDEGEALPAQSTAVTPEESLRSYEAFEALRTFEPGSSDASSLFKLIDSLPGSTNGSAAVAAPTPLHTAIRCAKLGTVDLILRHRPQDLNAVDPEGDTPLHLAASQGRTEIVKLLLTQASIDDSVRNKAGRTCLESAKGAETAKVIQISRAQYTQTYSSLLASYVNEDTPENREAIMTFLQRGRSRSTDLSTLTPGPRGTTIIHEAARRRDIDLLKLCIGLGCSCVIRDRRGKMPLDVAEDKNVRVLLRQVANNEGKALRNSASFHQNQGSLAGQQGGLAALAGNPSRLSTAGGPGAAGVAQPAAPQSMKGYLSKWTNMARGYRTRWFVLQNGHLSYYRDQEEEGQASRGTISMTVAVVEVAAEKGTFTIGTTLGKSPRWFLKGNHPVEALQWATALQSNIDYSRGTQGPAPGLKGGIGLSPSMSSSESAFMGRTASNRSEASLPLHSGRVADSERSSVTGSFAAVANATHSNDLLRTPSAKTGGSDIADPLTRTPSPSGTLGTDGSVIGEDNDDDNGVPGGYVYNSRHLPHEDNFHLLCNSTKTQLELSSSLLSSLSASQVDASKQAQVISAAQRSLRLVSNMLEQHFDQVSDREKWYVRRYEREMQAKKMWEENMRSVVTSQTEIENELRESKAQNSKRKKVLRDLRASVLAAEESSRGVGSTNESVASPGTPLASAGLQEGAPSTPGTARPNLVAGNTMPLASPHATLLQTIDLQRVDEAVASSDSSGDEDDFYDAIEMGGAIGRVESPLVQAPPALTQKSVEWPQGFKEDEHHAPEIESVEGYRHLRDRLPIASDERPPVSLWAILKGSIGKDLTKISFPVYFNEPTSMLQRMAEDMEYSECLDAAAAESDSLKRICFVTGFAMSNYASTIGRIAKPFNPMLSETFELANLEKKYRYMSEQVSHHPPMSACIAESPSWMYYGEVDAKSKFLGKSFEIRPTGVAHAELLLPQEWAPEYPAARLRDGHVKEHYSWKKVTTGISNFIMGAPQIDHYGDMEVTNHRTGERCVLTFKPKGWRAGNACEVKGMVYDSNNQLQWEMAGRWNGQLVARKAGAGTGALQPDDKVPTGRAPEYLLIWKINQQPPNMPFNLTQFALTLNDNKPEIKKYLPPTDCRLRPDQRLFENGQYEKANEMKSALEAFQRGVRVKREQGALPPHKARWFTRQMDPDSGQVFWEPVRLSDGAVEYWKERTRNFKKVQDGEAPEWKDVDEIFGVKD